ncbi:MAG: TRAP transporter small permease [Caldimonas sp.]|uniref:TRAP transporter small permease n=1 Tax=Caldimonas sp. TaxID=2838790 RepID=UPI00391D527B
MGTDSSDAVMAALHRPRSGPGPLALALRRTTRQFYWALAVLACLSILAAFACIVVGVIGRQVGFNIPGLDAYAGYAIAAALFLALPHTLVRGEHIRVTLVMQRLPARARGFLEGWSLLAGLGVSGYIAWYAGRLVWLSYVTHDVSSSSDATPLWIPQLSMALGCLGLALAFLEALWAHLAGHEVFETHEATSAE